MHGTGSKNPGARTQALNVCFPFFLVDSLSHHEFMIIFETIYSKIDTSLGIPSLIGEGII